MLRSSAKRSSALPSGNAGLRYAGAYARRGHVESWFLKANDPRGRRAIWLKWTLWAGDRAPERAVSEAWAVAFGTERGHVVTKSTVPFDSAQFPSDRLCAEIDGCTLSETAARGRVESGGRAVAYDLAVEALEPPLLLYPAAWMYEGPLPAQKVTSPVPNARISGRVEVGREHWALEGWPGMIGHNWGHRHADVYAWSQCNSWDDGEDMVLEGVSARVGTTALWAPTATVACVRYRGTSYALNKFASVARSSAEITPRRWSFRTRSGKVALTAEIWADTDDFVGLFYPNPDGTMCHCLNSSLARAEVTLRLDGQAPRTLRSSRAALEIGTRNPDHGVRMYL
jgi:hypothetical protein